MAISATALDRDMNRLRAALRARILSQSSRFGPGSGSISVDDVKHYAEGLVTLLEYEAAYKDPQVPRPQWDQARWAQFEADTATASGVQHCYRLPISTALAEGLISGSELRDFLVETEYPT